MWMSCSKSVNTGLLLIFTHSVSAFIALLPHAFVDYCIAEYCFGSICRL